MFVRKNIEKLLMMFKHDLTTLNIAVIGLGYVGLPLAVEFGKSRSVVGYDINSDRIDELKQFVDVTLEVSSVELREASKLTLSADVSDLKDVNCFIIAVPTPIDNHNQPNLEPLLSASKMVGGLLAKGSIVIFESTVFPGATEEKCVPVLEASSGLRFNEDFFCGYSPERVNPGDPDHRLPMITKITSGSTRETADLVDDLYSQIIKAGTYKVASIKIAEAAKVIENTQRDVNISLINELSIIFNLLEIDTEAVLEAAGTKWNFLKFRPGLVGGHCIGVDPYYLTHKALEIGYKPELILSGRRLNGRMGEYVAGQTIKAMTKKGIDVVDAKILILGLTFKENCPDLRNTGVMSVFQELCEFNCSVDIHDPWVEENEAMTELGVEVISELQPSFYDAIIIAVGHELFKNLGIENIRKLCKKNSIIYDLKYLFDEKDTDLRL